MLKRTIRFLLLGLAFLYPVAAQAQIAIIRSPGTPNFGPYFGRGPTMGFGMNPWGGGWGGRPWTGGAWGGVPAVSSTFYNPGWTYPTPFATNSFARSGPVILPGFAASDPPRARPTLYPAIPTPSRNIIQAALQDDSDNRAYIEVQVPTANARVSLDGVVTQQTGTTRYFKTPTLNPNSRYTFQVEVSWQEGGQTRTMRRQLTLRAGETYRLDLSQGE